MDPESTPHFINGRHPSVKRPNHQLPVQRSSNNQDVPLPGFTLYNPTRNTTNSSLHHTGSLSVRKNFSGGTRNKHTRSATVANIESAANDTRKTNNRTPVLPNPMQSHPQIHKRGFSRTMKSISSFIQIGVNIPPYVSFPLTIDKSLSIERLARQIEAEYAFKFSGIDQNCYEPLEVGLLYDVGMLALKFRDIVGDVLEHGDVVNVLNVYDEDYQRNSSVEGSEDESIYSRADYGCEQDIPSVQNSQSSHYLLQHNHQTWHKDAAADSIMGEATNSENQIQKIISQSDQRLRAILSNILAMTFFQKFTVREYSVENLLFWLDVELFAAGVSGTNEDNYFDENQTAVIHAKYIYLTYVHSHAPLQVNLSDEVKRAVPWPLDDDCVVDRRMFDEAQESVYQLMKGHTFLRFEESEEWKTCEKIKNEDPQCYASYEMTESIDKYFKPNMSLMLAVTMALDYGLDATPISHHYKEQTLHSMLSQYFPETILNNVTKRQHRPASSVPSHVVEGYFNSENRMTSAQRMRRIKKERKLQWVFGEKVSRLDGQIVIMPNNDLMEHDNRSSVISMVSETSRKTTKDVWNRKKKVEKLESIFGRELRDSQLISQNIFKKNGNANGEKVSKEKPADQEMEKSLKSPNELSPKERRMLWKKTKKLQVVLGQPLDENVVWQSLTLPAINSTTSPRGKQFSPTSLPVYDYPARNPDGTLSYVRRIPRRASDPMPPSPSLSVTSNSSSLLHSPLPPAPSMYSRPRSGSFDSATFSMSEVPLIIVNKDSKEYRRKKLQKLYHFLGEKVPVHIVLGGEAEDIDKEDSSQKAKRKNGRPHYSRSKHSSSENVADQSLREDVPNKLSAADKKRHLQRAVKLEKVFGEIPPQDLFKRSPTTNPEHENCADLNMHRLSIVSLGYLMDNDKEAVYELIDYMAESDEDDFTSSPNAINSAAHFDRQAISAPSSPHSESPHQSRYLHSKQSRMRGIRKLSHFFGATYGQMFPDQVLGEILGEIEYEIHEASRNDNVDRAVVDGLMGQLHTLRMRSGELAPSDDEMEDGGEIDNARSVKSGEIDNESIYEDVRKWYEKNGSDRVLLPVN
ncbi:10_t:CDS:2 [Paraglomus occultum]|uniref:10_t:CDS:1 n=1 Tax=Paraglomus occultum TaxID=144539 RepID=A0A9N9CG98_9GLOM|nr:10_t:CDS:2 [Paraglomus occultum]